MSVDEEVKRTWILLLVWAEMTPEASLFFGTLQSSRCSSSFIINIVVISVGATVPEVLARL
jgi:hypothetical protein